MSLDSKSDQRAELNSKKNRACIEKVDMHLSGFIEMMACMAAAGPGSGSQMTKTDFNLQIVKLMNRWGELYVAMCGREPSEQVKILDAKDPS